MKVKVGDTVYDASEEPVMVILTDQDKENIANMVEDASRYCMYPEEAFEDEEGVRKWMENISQE